MTLMMLAIIGVVLISAPLKAIHHFPRPTGPVNDFAGVISPHYKKMIEDISYEALQKTGTAIVVATVTSIGNNSLEEYVNKIYEDWGIGKKGEDKGILIFVAVKERKIRIETGYGVEGRLPDGLVGRILDTEVIPHLKQNDYGKGIFYAAKTMSLILTKEVDISKKTEGDKNARPGSLFLLIIFIFIIAPILFGKQTREMLPWLIFTAINSRNQGSGGFGGFGGGGFGGFGGGISGGGGASRGF